MNRNLIDDKTEAYGVPEESLHGSHVAAVLQGVVVVRQQVHNVRLGQHVHRLYVLDVSNCRAQW